MDRFPRNFKLATGLKRVAPPMGAAAEADREKDAPAPVDEDGE
jgi:hypothetical protein